MSFYANRHLRARRWACQRGFAPADRMGGETPPAPPAENVPRLHPDPRCALRHDVLERKKTGQAKKTGIALRQETRGRENRGRETRGRENRGHENRGRVGILLSQMPSARREADGVTIHAWAASCPEIPTAPAGSRRVRRP